MNMKSGFVGTGTDANTTLNSSQPAETLPGHTGMISSTTEHNNLPMLCVTDLRKTLHYCLPPSMVRPPFKRDQSKLPSPHSIALPENTAWAMMTSTQRDSTRGWCTTRWRQPLRSGSCKAMYSPPGLWQSQA